MSWEILTRCTNKKTGMVRYAAFAFNLGDRISWVEPGYLDYSGGTPAYHEAHGDIVIDSDRVSCGHWVFEGMDAPEDMSNAQIDFLQTVKYDVEAERIRLGKTIPEVKKLFL